MKKALKIADIVLILAVLALCVLTITTPFLYSNPLIR